MAFSLRKDYNVMHDDEVVYKIRLCGNGWVIDLVTTELPSNPWDTDSYKTVPVVGDEILEMDWNKVTEISYRETTWREVKLKEENEL